jgi:hypothetical protein
MSKFGQIVARSSAARPTAVHPGGGFFGTRLAVVSDRVKLLIRLKIEGSDLALPPHRLLARCLRSREASRRASGCFRYLRGRPHNPDVGRLSAGRCALEANNSVVQHSDTNDPNHASEADQCALGTWTTRRKIVID